MKGSRGARVFLLAAALALGAMVPAGWLPVTAASAATAGGAGSVEPASARLRIVEAAPIYSQPSRHSKKIGTLDPGKFIQVTGSTRYYLQVQLKSGETGYIAPSGVRLVTPTKKAFQLTANSPVFSVPNQWGRKVATVHKGRYVHVTGIALNYVRVRLRNGTVGFVPLTAVQ